MSKQIEMKMQLLDELKDLLLGRDGEKLKPAAIEVEVMSAEPEDEEELEPVEVEHCMAEDDEEEEPRRKTLREFLGR